MKRFLFFLFVTFLRTSLILHAWPAEVIHLFNERINSHVFLIGDVHAGEQNQNACEDAQAIINGTRMLKAHLILEDPLVGFIPQHNTLKNTLAGITGHEQLLSALLFADPANFDFFTLSRRNLMSKLLQLFGHSTSTLENLHQTTSQNIQKNCLFLPINASVSQLISPLLGFSLLADANNIRNTNIEWRHALIASLSGSPVSARQVFKSINKTIQRIRSYNDCPVLNQFYTTVIEEYHASCAPFNNILAQLAQSELPMLEALDNVPLETIREMANKCSTDTRSFYSEIQPTTTNANLIGTDLWPDLPMPTKSEILTEAFSHISLLDPIIAHHIFKEYQSGPIIVYAGTLHTSAIMKLLYNLEYLTVDYSGALTLPAQPERGELAECCLKPLDLNYYFSHFKNGARILPLNEIMDQAHYCPILRCNNINFVDEHNMTMLMHAAQLNHYSTARYCMLNDACTSIRNEQGQTALDLARAHNSIAILKLFEEFNVTQ